MSDDNVGRTNTPAFWNAFGGAKRLWLLSAVIPLVAIAPFVMDVIWPPAPDDIDQIIRKAGFSPLPSPSRLRGPGALYKVEEGDDNYEKVCKEPAITAQKMQASRTQDRMLQKLEKSGFSLVGDLVETLNTKLSLSGAQVTSVQYQLTNVTIYEISGDDLLELQETMLRERHCREIVDHYLKNNKRICPVSMAISATTSYKVHVDQNLKTDAGREPKEPVVNIVQKVIEEKTLGQIQVQSESQLVGENLFLGIRLSSFCVTPGGATEPIPAPPVVAKEKTAALP
jgi:hypothetical protein